MRMESFEEQYRNTDQTAHYEQSDLFLYCLEIEQNI